MLTYEKQALSGTIEVLLRSELPDEFEGTKLYGSLEEDELQQDCKIFRLSNETGHGRITVYQVFSGIELYYNDMHMGYCNQNQATAKNMIEINHCLIGRFECSFGENSCCYMAEGDLSISSMMKKKSNSCFPLNHYHGISIIINLDELLPEVRRIMELLNIDLHYIQKYICEGNRCCIMRAKSITKQRMTLLDGSSLGAMAHYLISDAGEEKTQETFGAGWQSAATAENIVSLNEAVEHGFYPYVFDRALEMGNDTVLIQIQELKNKEKDIESVTKAAEELSYELDSQNDSYLLYHREVSGNFGTVTKYDGIAIGSSASLITYEYPDMETGDSKYIDEYSYGDLSSYQIVYLAGFSYHSKSQAEALVRQLASAGIRVIINGDGVPVNEQTQIQEFLGITCHSIFFENGYPVLYTEGGEVDTELFDRENTDWKTVYFNGLDQSYGYLYDAGMKVDFAGTAGDENIVFVG